MVVAVDVREPSGPVTESLPALRRPVPPAPQHLGVSLTQPTTAVPPSSEAGGGLPFLWPQLEPPSPLTTVPSLLSAQGPPRRTGCCGSPLPSGSPRTAWPAGGVLSISAEGGSGPVPSPARDLGSRQRPLLEGPVLPGGGPPRGHCRPRGQLGLRPRPLSSQPERAAWRCQRRFTENPVPAPSPGNAHSQPWAALSRPLLRLGYPSPCGPDTPVPAQSLPLPSLASAPSAVWEDAFLPTQGACDAPPPLPQGTRPL